MFKFSVKNKIIDSDIPLIMGIVNVTPDSFSDGGKYFNTDNAVNHTMQLVEAGADIIDIGGESTRPGSDFISEEEEVKRVIPVIKKLMKIEPSLVISVDTTKSRVAEVALAEGASIINDISSGLFDSKMFSVAAKFDAPIILMHIKDNPKTMQENPYYENVSDEVLNFLKERISIAKTSGINKIIIDPGIGFGKTVEHNFELLNKIDEFKKLQFPILIGVSRKSFIGKTFDLEISERDFATSIIETIMLKKGVNIIRTHNVANAVMVKKICSLVG
ncbi:MAG: dihydropteroate synthase [Ignavibacteriaceae bacterium]|nr:dihydropteroate synthase [Ignavibacteriaceae bacterium]